MIYEQFFMFTGGAETLHSKTGVENVNLWGGAVSKACVVSMIHCSARFSWKIKQNFTAAKVANNTQNQGLQICERYGKRLFVQQDAASIGEKFWRYGTLYSGLNKGIRWLHLSLGRNTLPGTF